MAIIAVPKRRPWDVLPGTAAVSRGISVARRYPVIPLAVLMVLLIIPALFANQIAPHDHRIGDLSKVKLPPGWVGAQLAEQTVVERLGRVNRGNEIALSKAQRKFEKGEVTFLTGGADGEVNVGDRLSVVIRGAGSWT